MAGRKPRISPESVAIVLTMWQQYILGIKNDMECKYFSFNESAEILLEKKPINFAINLAGFYEIMLIFPAIEDHLPWETP